METTKDAYGVEFSFSGTWIQQAPADLEEYVVPEGVERIRRNAFAACTKLRKITLPTSLASLDYDTFHHCTALREIIMPELCQILYQMTVPIAPHACIIQESDEDFYLVLAPASAKSRYAQQMHAEKTTVFQVPEGVKSISSTAFFDCDLLTKIIFPKTLELIEVGAFINCPNLKVLQFQTPEPPAFEDDTDLIDDSKDYASAPANNFERILLVPKGSAQLYANELSQFTLRIEETEK